MLVKKLIIIAGPSCSGKSYLMEKIKHGKYPLLFKRLGGINPNKTIYSALSELKHMRESCVETLVLHYDFSAHNWGNKGFDILEDLISASNIIIVLTLYLPSKILISRLNRRILSCCVLRLRGHEVNPPLSKLWKKRKEYKDGFILIDLYEKWLTFLSMYNISSHWLLYFNEYNNFKVDACGENAIEIITNKLTCKRGLS